MKKLYYLDRTKHIVIPVNILEEEKTSFLIEGTFGEPVKLDKSEAGFLFTYTEKCAYELTLYDVETKLSRLQKYKFPSDFSRTLTEIGISLAMDIRKKIKELEE